jgi:quercetin dioxygenase-like cupin family protein
MEIIVGITEFKPGEDGIAHIHHGEEAFYILEGATVELPDGRRVDVPVGATNVNVRDVPHGAGKVVGDKSLKILTVHIVDKGKPLYDKPK